MLWCDLFLPCSLLIQDGLSDDQWKEVEEAAASAKVRKVWLYFGETSRQRPRAVQSISNGLALNKFIGHIELFCIPKDTNETVRQSLTTVTEVYVF